MLYFANCVGFLEDQQLKQRFQQKDFVTGGNLATSAESTIVLCVIWQATVETQKVCVIHQIIDTVNKQRYPNFRNEKFIGDIRKHLMTVLDIITFCAKQDIPLRGDDESDQSLNKGNFFEILEILGKYDSNVTKRIESLPGNAKMLSPDIQNDLFTSLASVLLDYVKSEVEIASCYAILA
ncbi:Zinc finger MYM-type protein 1-like [Oopsacas minuta]|uniref:Zinc finger MYM-type protein 1-like n=1 Tax=Oopsacas minuta TaxID=111878 RepID=A0AAV7KCJ9_9METZ|nr:Zinc finger MYM-type protein 1-like [Oopsacas minuta]